MSNDIDLPTTIKNAREKIGISQRELARRLNVGNNTIARLENGERKTTNALTLKKMAEVLSINYSDLLKKAGFSETDIEYANKDSSNITFKSKNDIVYSIDEYIEKDKEMLARAENSIKKIKHILKYHDDPVYKTMKKEDIEFFDEQFKQTLLMNEIFKKEYTARIKQFEKMKK